MKDIIITTTPTIETSTITEYLGVVRSNMVVGVNVFKDLFASFSDFFGGFSGKYKGELDKVYQSALKEINQNAMGLKADAIVGLSVDFDEISGKDKSMLMVTLFGTAVKLKEEVKCSVNVPEDSISCEALFRELKVAEYKESIRQAQLFSDNAWQTIISFGMVELCEDMIQLLIKFSDLHDPYYKEKYEKNLPSLLTQLPYEQAIELVYQPHECCVKLIKKCQLFNAKKILEFGKTIKSDKEMSYFMDLLTSEKSSYSKSDLEDMKALASYLENLPVLWILEESKGGLLSSSKPHYRCICGSKNSENAEHCMNCGRNKQGLQTDDVDSIQKFIHKVDALEKLLGRI